LNGGSCLDAFVWQFSADLVKLLMKVNLVFVEGKKESQDRENKTE
jgi:hypothetical protein